MVDQPGDDGAPPSLGSLLLQIPALGTMIVDQLVAGVQPAGTEAVATERALVSLAQCSRTLHRAVAGALMARRSLRSGRPGGRAKIFTLQSNPAQALGLGLGHGRGRGRGQSDAKSVAVVATKRLHEMYLEEELYGPNGDEDAQDEDDENPAWLTNDQLRSVYQREAIVGIPLSKFYSRRGIDPSTGLPGARHLDLVIGHEQYRAVDVFLLVDDGAGQLCAVKTHCEYGYMLPMPGWAAIEVHGLTYFHAFPDIHYCHVMTGSKLWQRWLSTRPSEGHQLYAMVEEPRLESMEASALMDVFLQEQPIDAEWEPGDTFIGWSSLHPLMV
eukprot:COSAG02_NODE_295_length_25421_cov_88.063226_11_plen_328_part_00